MKLYIRSQNGTFIGKLDFVSIENQPESMNRKFAVIGGVAGDRYFLGDYETKERVKKVIDDMQAHIVNYDRFVYNMPKE